MTLRQILYIQLANLLPDRFRSHQNLIVHGLRASNIDDSLKELFEQE